ncbi:MAG: hypothetical protein PHN78_02745 [Dehalococcoidales bacterium]|nr:hypothetical protein [Dehalococcoidales bacterium]
MGGKQWTIFSILIGTTLTLIGLGFAAMSTNPAFKVQSWVPYIFFIAAGILFIFAIGYLIHSIVNKRQKKRENERQPNDGTILLQLLDEIHQKVSLITERTINRLRDYQWQGIDRVFEDVTGISPHEFAIAVQYWVLKGIAQFMMGEEITVDKEARETTAKMMTKIGTAKNPERLATDLSLSIRHRFLDQQLKRDHAYNILHRSLRRERDKYPDEAVSRAIESYLDHSFKVNAAWVIAEFDLAGIPSFEQTFEYRILPGHIVLKVEDIPNQAAIEMERFRNKVAVAINAYLKEEQGRIVHRQRGGL